MRAVTSAALFLPLALFLQACGVGTGSVTCSHEGTPTFSAPEEQITRNDVVAELGEPIDTIESEDGHRVDIYEYDKFCTGILWIFVPLPLPGHLSFPDQMLTAEYGPDSSFLTVKVWRGVETPEYIVEFYEGRMTLESECNLPYSEARPLHEWPISCRGIERLTRWTWECLAAHQGASDSQYVIAGYYKFGLSSIQSDIVAAYKWYSLASMNGSESASNYLGFVAHQMTPDQLAEAERLVAEWEPNPAECEKIAAQAEN
jgi:hypothetical protein